MDWLKKNGTDRVFPRTAHLAKRPDMIPVSEEEAKVLMKRLSEYQVSRVRAIEAGKPDPDIGKKLFIAEDQKPEARLEDMTDEQLRLEAEKMKVFVHHRNSRETIIEKLKQARLADKKTIPDVAPAPKVPEELKELLDKANGFAAQDA